MASAESVAAVIEAGGAHVPGMLERLEARLAEVAASYGPVLGEHAGAGVRAVAELRDLGDEIWSPPDGGGWGMQSGALHEFAGGAGAASVPGRCPGRVIRRPRRD